ncbi:formylglycine-generating enzyme family protein [Nostoc sp.]|uniref:formylglycine-generating enzyme family protein n=1 Tax=Nostoc sp. TaxID=1180 RepID=UPI003FA59222
MNYGQQGLDLVIQALNDEARDVQDAAYSLLTTRTGTKVKQALKIRDQARFKFETVTVDARRNIINRSILQAQYFVEDLGNGVTLQMVQIPGGTFLMGSPEREEGRRNSESPQHQVTVPGFFMGKYQVTQEQYQVIMGTNRSRFKGEKRPVEMVDWYEAIEFCQKLSQKTRRIYRLPSEAEWEYACRAGTTTPFHCGETITSELANYRTYNTDSDGVKGKHRMETTKVESFGVANAFGLYDMHGNVWEWCLDDWHDNYESAPTDGSPWFDNSNNLFQKKGFVVLRGGSWGYDPRHCRSASRLNHSFSYRNAIDTKFGFRVVCDAVVKN